MAKNVVQSWKYEETFEFLNEQDSVRSQIYSRTYAEQWAVNASVHYNNWANLEVPDFWPVVEAFQDLYGLFVCNKCGGFLRLSVSGITPTNVKCRCDTTNWN